MMGENSIVAVFMKETTRQGIARYFCIKGKIKFTIVSQEGIFFFIIYVDTSPSQGCWEALTKHDSFCDKINASQSTVF